ncbi:MAG: GNAT family N-acetyltransferase [Kutzneria sp.]|nr:GNAT family N-acetyltransferase [Kutzneria sp.]
MAVVSLGYRTDLMLLGLQGSVVSLHHGYSCIRTPANPTFHWGNLVLLRAPPAPGTVASWVTVFRHEFPHANHVTLGVDGTEGDSGDPAELEAAGLEAEVGTVLTATAVCPPPRPHRDAELRPLVDDQDWRAALALREANNVLPDVEGFRVFAWRRLVGLRRLQERGLGAWFGAFHHGRMVSGLGVFTDGHGLARFQHVDTHPEYRGRGLAGTLVYTAGRYALDRLGARRLVIVADPGYVSIRVYRSVGFADEETQVRVQRRQPVPPPAPAQTADQDR